MESEARLGVIGAGRMAYAIVSGALNAGLFSPKQIVVSDPSAERQSEFLALGVEAFFDNAALARGCTMVLLSVKPQAVADVMGEIGPLLAGKTLVSIAAGVSRDYLSQKAPGAYMIRVMPNTPLLVGCGATAITPGEGIPPSEYAAAVSLFSDAGAVETVEDAQMNAVIGVNGSSPAYFFRMADAVVRVAVSQDLDADAALRLFAQSMEGAARMLLRSGHPPLELMRQVCSPGGTTLAALTAFDEFGFDRMMAEALGRCKRRAEELSL